jgi:hypothetical protein
MANYVAPKAAFGGAALPADVKAPASLGVKKKVAGLSKGKSGGDSLAKSAKDMFDDDSD